MFLRHFGLMLIAFFAVSCSSSHTAPMPDAGRPFVPDDAGPPDSGMYEWPDASPPLEDVGTVSDAYAAPDVPPAPDAGLGTLRIGLSSFTPPGRVVSPNSTGVIFVRFELEAGDTAIRVSSITVHRRGAGTSTDLSSVYLLDAVTWSRLSLARTIDPLSNTVTFNFFGDEVVTVPALRARQLFIGGDFDHALPGGDHAFEIVSASAINAEAALVSGVFPAVGNHFTVGYVPDAATLTVRSEGPLPDVALGNDRTVAQFTLTAGANRVMFDRLLLTQTGSCASDQLANLVLYRGSEIVSESVYINRTYGQYTIWFGDTQFIEAGSSETLTLHADVSGSADCTSRIYMEYPIDIDGFDDVLCTPAHVDVSSYDGSDPGNYSEVTIR